MRVGFFISETMSTTTTDTPAQFTDQQLSNFHRYEQVRQGSRFNMFDPRARQLTGMERDEYLFVMENYVALEQAAEQQKAADKK